MKFNKLYLIVFIVLLVSIILFSYIGSIKEGFDNDFKNKQLTYYKQRNIDIKKPISSDAEVFKQVVNNKEEYNLVNKVTTSNNLSSNPYTFIDSAVEKCKKIKKCGDITSGCGICLSKNKGMIGDSRGPYINTCPSGWVSNVDDCLKEKERMLCSKVKNCNSMIGKDYEICGWSQKHLKAVPAKRVIGVLVPKYKEDEYVGKLQTHEDCAMKGACLKTWDGTGHSDECLQQIWSNVGCSSLGKSSPSKHNSFQNQWWKARTIKEVQNDMALYKKYADSTNYNLAKNYYPRCYGGNLPNQCSDKFITKQASCLQKEFIDSGCLKTGTAYPNKSRNISLENYKNEIINMISNAHNKNLDFNTRNKAYNQCYGGSLMINQDNNMNVKQGLNVYLYDNISSSGVPGNLIQETPVRISNININWGTNSVFGSKKDNIYAVVKSYITYPKEASIVRFRIGNDDGSRLYINGKMEIDNWELNGFKWDYGSDRTINNRVEELTIHMYKKYGGSNLRLQWSIDGKGWEDIPNKYYNSTIINKQNTGYNEKDYVMYGSWMGRGREVPIKRIVKDGSSIAYITEQGIYTKIVKMWGNTPVPLYYKGKIIEYGTKNMNRAPNGVYRIKNIKTGETLGH